MPGVYGLSNAREWVFVGVTNDIRASLLGHLQERNTELKSRAPTGFTFEICHPGQSGARMSRLVIGIIPGLQPEDSVAPNVIPKCKSPGILRPLGWNGVSS